MSKLNKRIMSAVLAFILFMTNIPVVGSADNSTFAITYEGETVKKVEFYNHEKITVCAENIPEGSHQWQIKIPGTEQWVNIHGQTDAEIGLSYAVVGSLLEDDRAYVRCAAISEGLEIAHTATLRVTVKEEPVRQEPVYVAPVVEATEAPVEETEAPIEETEAPVEETEAPIEETEAPIEETEAPVEETEATVEETEATVEETEASVEETEASVEETEAPVEETEAPVEETEAPVEAAETPAEPVAEVPAAPAEEEPAAPVAETEAVVEEPAAPVAETEAATEETEEATEATAEPTEAPKKTSKKSSKKSSEKATQPVTNQKTESVTPKAAGTDVEIVTVTVHYRAVDREDKFETTHEDATIEANAANAEPVTDSYVARIVKGSALNVTIPCHVMPGYTLEVPQYHKDDPITVSGNNLVLDLDAVEEDTTFYAYYKEAKVPYTARYFMQNVYNDLYTEDTTILTAAIKEQMKGYPGEEPNPLIIYPNVTGFTALFFQPDTIAADGSTVFEVYYDRNYYLMNFNMDGGYGTAPVYARYETAFTVADPTKSGWSFNGWELELVNGVAATAEQKAQAFPTTIPAENRTYKAKWDHGTTSYTVVYWLEGADTDKYNYYASKVYENVESGTGVSALESKHNPADLSTVFGDEAKYIEFNENKTKDEEAKQEFFDQDTRKVIVQGDGSTVVNVYYQHKEYTLKFYYARTTGGTDSDGDEIRDTGFSRVEIPGGTTWPFGFRGNSENSPSQITPDDETLLRAVGTWGKITGTELPTLKSNQNTYQKGVLPITIGTIDYNYHYLTFTARYGDNISSKWPCDVFSSTTRDDTGSNGSWTNKTAVVSAWNPESQVKYVRDNENPTIKGKYELLDENLLFAPQYEDSSEVSFLCFWENGAPGVGWNVPELYRYNIFLEVLPGQDLTGETVITKVDAGGTSKTYVRISQYDTCDDSDVGKQTQPSLVGYTPKYYTSSSKTYNGIELTDNEISVSYAENGKTDDDNNKLYFEYVILTKGTDYDGSVYNEGYEMNFYYTRNVHKLNFWNRNDWLNSGEGVEGGVAYGASLAKYFNGVTVDGHKYDGANDIVVKEEKYPSGLEPGAYKFDAWYTTANCLEGTKVDWETMTMPDHDLTVYAKWEPVTYDTYFYMDYEQYEQGKEKAFDTVTGTPHGTAITETIDVPKHPEGGDRYIFVGWFYIDGDDTKKAFNPAEMAVRRELHLFAEWTTATVKEYTVSYHQGKWNETTGEYESLGELAEDSKGYALEATTKTFKALPKDKLNLPEGTENQLWLPHTNSHSIVMRSENSENVFTFYYITADEAPYTVRYLDATTHEPIWKDGEGKELMGGDEHNKDAVVTETFRYFQGYIPDAFHKQLILSANDAENVIIFYYTKDSEVDDGDVGGDPGEGRARYLVVHHYPELDGSDYRVEEDKIGNIGETGIGTEQERAGFEFAEGITKENKESNTVSYDDTAGKWTVSGTITSGADTGANKPLELHLYYNRLNYGYRIIHKDRETGITIKEERVGLDTGKESEKVPFESVVSATATGIQGYDLYDADTDGTKTLTLKISWDDEMNVITFEYIRKKLTIEYIPVCTDDTMTGFGGVSNPLDYDKATPTGSQAYAASGFQFLGWYENWGTEQEKLVSVDEHFIPTVDISTGIYDYTFYALFEPIDLTVTYNANGGVEVPSKTSHVGKTITLPTTTKEGYTLLGWWYDADDDGAIDEGEEYAVGSEFTMPAKNVDFTAQWIDYRIDDSHNVLVGINMSFYKDGDSLYYSFPPGEPTVVNLEAARAYIATEDEDGNTWMIRTEGTWNKPLPGKFEDYIDPTILTAGDLVTNGDVIGVYDETGVKTKKYLRLTDADYLGIVQAWLNAENYLKGHFSSANIDWDSLPSDPNEYEVIPYVVKRHWHGVAGKTDWFIDVIIVPKDKYKITYELDLKDGYVDTAPQDNNEYGQGFIANVADFHDVARTDNSDYIAKFLGWHYDANGNGEVDDGEVYAGGSKITIPAENVVLTALWSYRMNLTIQTTALDEGQHYIFNVSGTAEDGTNVNLTVSLGANDIKKIVDLSEGTYAVTEQSDWRWKYGMPAITKTPTTETPTHWKFDYTSAEVDWLGGEGYNPNKFDAVT